MKHPAAVQIPDYFSRQIIRANRFYRRPDSDDFAVLAGGRESCAPGYRIDRSDFPYYALEFVIAGRGSLDLGEQSCEIAAGTLFCYGPGIPHRIVNDREGVLEKFFFNVRGSGAAELLEKELSLTGKVLHTSQPAALFSLFEELIHQGLENGPWSDRICSSLVEALACKAASGALEPGSSKSTGFACFQRCRNYIGTHYRELKSLQEACRACGVSPSYLCRLFRQFDHSSPYQYLLRLKMNHAAELLLLRGMQVQEVAGELGFDDPLHFSRSFKQVIGTSPRELARLTGSAGTQAQE